MGREYVYEFEPNGHIRSQADEVWKSAATTTLDGVRSTTWLGPFSVPERDLLRVMAAALEADRLSPRRPPNAKHARREFGWQRDLRLRIAVESPERWKTASNALCALLSFMSDDQWAVEFVHAAPPAGQQQLLPLTHGDDVDEVALFSGGLDSVAGMFARGHQQSRRLLAVSACGNDVRRAAQKAALDSLRDAGIRAGWLRIDHQVRGARRSRTGMESSQRTRGLLFLAMGAASASRLELPTFSVYETGVGCINLPTSAAQVGAQATRAMHPRTLALFNALVAVILDRPVRVIAPFFLLTKGELCALTGDRLTSLAGVSMSCDEGEGHKRDPMLHCGLCTSCLFRRIALHASNQDADNTRYRDMQTRRHGAYELLAFEHHAAVLRTCRSFSDLVDLDPAARFAAVLPIQNPLEGAASKTAVFQMYQRYAGEIELFLGGPARPMIAKRPLGPRKELDRDLFAAAG